MNQSTALKYLSLAQIRSNSMRPRQTISQKSLTELADSIRKYGVLSPLLVNKQGNVYQLICGERRYRAAKIAGLEEVPCLIVSIDPRETSMLSLAENLQRENLNLIDQSILFKKLHEQLNYSLVDIGHSTGMSQEYVKKLIQVLGVPEKMRRKYLEGTISAEDLLLLADIHDPIIQESTYSKLIS